MTEKSPSQNLHIPLDRKASDPGLFGKDVSPHTVHDGLGWRLGVEFFRIVLVIDVVADSYELPAIVAASE